MDLFFNYLKTLRSDELCELFTHPACACITLRCLNEIGKSLITLLVNVNHPIEIITVRKWFNAKVHASLRLEIDSLTRLQILQLFDPKGNAAIRLKEEFRNSILRNIREGIVVSSDIRVADGSVKIDAKARKLREDLFSYASERWDNVLQFLALCSPETIDAIEPDILNVLLDANFVKKQHGSYDITSDGFQFLLLDRRRQLWRYIIAHLNYLTKKGGKRVQFLPILCKLLLCTDVETAYLKSDEANKQSSPQADYLHHLREIGIVQMRKRKEIWYYTTPFVDLLNGVIDSRGDQATHDESNRYLVIETNFRIYAYTSSSLQLSILSTFTEMNGRFSNMSVGVLTRDSVRKALQVGIQAEQIITFLREHAHPQMLESTEIEDIIPPTVSDQILLWQLERDRFSFVNSVAYSQFDSIDDYQNVLAFTIENDCLLWSSDDARMIIVNEEKHNDVKAFFKRIKRERGN